MNKLFLSVTLATTCLVSTLTLAGSPTLSGSLIEKRDERVQKLNPNDTLQENSNTVAREPIKNDASLGRSAIEKHEKNVQQHPPLQENSNSKARVPIKNNGSLGGAAIEKHEKNVNQ